GRCVSYWEEPGVAVTCRFEVAEAGEYCLTLRYACTWPDTRRRISIDDEVVPGLEDVLLPGTGSWADFSAMTVAGPDGGRARIPLGAGVHTLTLTNVDSRGLAWDQALLHGPEDLPADAPLSEEELQELAEALPQDAGRVLLEGERAAALVHGAVRVALPGNMPLAVTVGDVFFVLPRPLTYESGLLEWTSDRIGPLHVLRAPYVDETMRVSFVVITNGHSCVSVVAAQSSEGLEGQADHLPGPLVAWRDGRPWRLAPGPLADKLQSGESTRALRINGVVASVDDYLSASVEEEPIPHLQLHWQPLRTGDVSVATAKVGPSVAPGDVSVATRVDGDEVVIRSSAHVPPALAAFYGMPQFEVRVQADASMTVTTEAGETLEVTAP
ncbi:MAG: hypothetical protein U9R79_12045, partial [Armatimonadota bacterium]|nr:hypothetical protein [Armatimonadota bacterium]